MQAGQYPKLIRMRRLAWIAGVFLACVSFVHAQWTIEDSTSAADLRGIDNVGRGVAWASGANGTVLRTEDGGYLWQRCTIPPGAEHLDFRGIQAFDANTAIVMSSGKGDLSRLYKTTDGCMTWKLVFTNPEEDGFWDALLMTDRNIGILIGDPVRGGHELELTSVRDGSFVFPTYHSIDGGNTWRRNDHGIFSASIDKNGQFTESIFAASNSSILLVPFMELFVTGGTTNGLHYYQYFAGPAPESCKAPCHIASETGSTLASGETAGGFSLASNYHFAFHSAEKLPDSLLVVAVGGNFKLPESSGGSAAVCHAKNDRGLFHFGCDPAQTPPHGYRSSVAYDDATKTWITVGPNGTDISTDGGRNWRALHPNPALHEPGDADRNWNALSIPFVVGPHGRIGKLNPNALTR